MRGDDIEGVKAKTDRERIRSYVRGKGAYVIESVRSGRGCGWAGELYTKIPPFRKKQETHAKSFMGSLVVFFEYNAYIPQSPISPSESPITIQGQGGRDIKEVLDPPVATGKGEMNQGARMAVVEGTRGGAEREARTKIAGPSEGRWGE